MLEPWAWRHHAWKKRPLWWLIERRNLISAALLHATSEQEAISLRQRNLKSPIAVIPNGVDIPNLPARTSKSGRRTALFLSRLHPKKGLPMLIEAWARIRPKGWRLQIAGPDEANHRSALESLVHQAGLDTEIHFLGPLAGGAKTLAFIESDLFILPTHSENFGMAIAEALAHGLPVITTQGAPWPLLQTEHCGWWTPPDVDGLTSALQEATCMNHEQLTQMGHLGRILMRDRFGWSAVARQMLDCYQWLREDGTRPSCVTVF
jgi:glycosyltransferase involved in cell wall biosynthesis